MIVNRHFRHAALVMAALVLIDVAGAQTVTPKRIYMAPDDHTDYVWSAGDAAYNAYFPQALDYYLDQIDATAGAPADQQMRWNTDGSLWLWEYERQRSPAELDRLITRIRDGHVSMPLNTLVSVHGASPVEAVIRDMYYAGRLERRFGLRFRLAIAMENQTAPLGLGAVFAGAGARYSWKGICGWLESRGYCTRVPMAGDREYDAYWWRGRDGSRLLTKWNSIHGFLPSAQDANQGIGGYAEARFPREVIPFVSGDAGFRARWPYDVIGVFGAGWDDFPYYADLADPARSQPLAAAQLSDSSRRVIVSNTEDFFRDFETVYGAGLPEQAVSFGNEWEVNVAAFAEKSARVRRAVEKLRAAEAMATLVELETPGALAGREAARDIAFRNMGLFFEHNVGGGGPGPDAGNAERVAFQERMVAGIEAYVDDLHAAAQTRLAGLIGGGSDADQLFVFNPLGFARNDLAEVAWPGSGPVHVVNLAANRQVPSETIGDGANRRLRFVASGIPAFGYTIFAARAGAGTAFAPVATFRSGVLASANWQLSLDSRGAIASLVQVSDRRQWVRRIDGLAINDFGEGAGTVTLERIGPVTATLRADVTGDLSRQVRVTLTRGLNRVEIENIVDGGFTDIKTHSFALAVDAPIVRHEEVGAVLTARLAPQGDYSPRARNSLYEWLTMNHFADMSDGTGSYGLTIANHDAYVMRIGRSTTGTLDTDTPRIDVMLGGQIPRTSGITDQGGDRRITHRFSLLPHGAYSRVDAMKAALAATNPFVVGRATGGAGAPLFSNSFSTLSGGGTNALVWALKPAEEGIGSGVIARVWNLGTTPSTLTFGVNQRYRIASRQRVSLIETDLPANDPIVLPNPTQLRPEQLGAIRLRVVRR